MAKMTAQEVREKLADDVLRLALSGDPQGWRQPWRRVAPHCSATGHEYQGTNAYILALVSHADVRIPTHDGRWATYKQWQEQGVQVQKGETGVKLLRVSTRYVPVRKWRGEVPGHLVVVRDGERFVKYLNRGVFTVFHAVQTDAQGLDPVDVLTADAHEVTDRLEASARALGIGMAWTGSSAFYTPVVDMVTLPPREAFHDGAGMVATLAHEVVHATGHDSRLDRPKGARFGTPQYAREELVAEIGSALVMQTLGCGTWAGPGVEEQHADYLANWLTALGPQDARAAILEALDAATAAADMVTAVVPETVRELVDA